MKAALYARISRETETSTSIDRQIAALRDLAEREGWTVVVELVDRGISGGKARDRAERAARMLHDGEVDVIAAWRFDRWGRRGLRDVVALQDALDHRERTARGTRRPKGLFVGLDDGVRSDSSSWTVLSAVLAAVARTERENTASRVSAAIAANRRAGLFTGGTPPTGYRSVQHENGRNRTLEPDADAAALLEDAARRIVAGESVYAAAMRLSASPLRPPRADRWSVQSLTRVLTGTALAGRVVVDGRVLEDDDGAPRQVFAPAIPLDLWHGVRAVLAERREGGSLVGKRSPGRRSRLLSGLAACRECGAPLYLRHTSARRPTGSDPSAPRPRGPLVYACSARSNGADTPSVTVTAERLEEYVTARYLAMAGSFEAVRPVVTERASTTLLDAEEALADVVALLGDADLPEDEEGALLARRRSLAERVRALRVERDEAAPEVSYEPTGETVAEVWHRSDVDAQRAMLASAFDEISVGVGRRGAHGLDPARVTLVVHEGDGIVLD